MAVTVIRDKAAWRQYGIGIDCHQEFLEVAVMVPVFEDEEVQKFTATFGTTPPEIARAKSWARSILADHRIHPKQLLYTLEEF